MKFNRIDKLPTLETERLILRPFRIEDAPDFYQVNKDPEVTRYTGDGGSVSAEEIEHRIREHVLADYRKHGFGRWAVIYKEDNQLIGFAGLKFLPDLNAVDLGYRFSQKYWGKGIATEASKSCLQFGFETLGLKQIIAHIMPENVGSARVLEKLGFTFVREFYEDSELEYELALKATDYNTKMKL